MRLGQDRVRRKTRERRGKRLRSRNRRQRRKREGGELRSHSSSRGRTRRKPSNTFILYINSFQILIEKIIHFIHISIFFYVIRCKEKANRARGKLIASNNRSKFTVLWCFRTCMSYYLALYMVLTQYDSSNISYFYDCLFNGNKQ